MAIARQRLRRLCRLADAQGLTLREVPKRNAWHDQHHLFLLIDAASKSIVASGISDLDGVAATLVEQPGLNSEARSQDGAV